MSDGSFLFLSLCIISTNSSHTFVSSSVMCSFSFRHDLFVSCIWRNDNRSSTTVLPRRFGCRVLLPRPGEQHMGSSDSIGDVYRQCNWGHCSGRADAKERLQLCIFIHVLCIFGRVSIVYDSSFQCVLPCSSVPVSSFVSRARSFIEDYSEYSSNVPK